VALVSHADVIKGFLAHLMGVPLDLFHRIQIGPASVSVVALDDSSPRILRINDDSDLPAAEFWERELS
jgi:probable phosphoglycerate mutase